MTDERDPVGQHLDDRDLYEISTWEERSPLDRFVVGLSSHLAGLAGLLALLLLVGELATSGFSMLERPTIGLLTLLSVVPAFALVWFIWHEDATKKEPLGRLFVTFSLGILLFGVAVAMEVGAEKLLSVVPFVGQLAFYVLVVGPVEEVIKWTAVRAYAYRRFESVVDGAVYGAVAGLGFTTFENASYITWSVLGAGQLPLVQMVGARALVGPGHVLTSAIAGYYLGLARFNREQAIPIVVKGLLIASVVHGVYDVLVTEGYNLGLVKHPTLSAYVPLVYLAFVLVYNGAVGTFLFRKLLRYRRAYDEAVGGNRDRRTDRPR